MGRRAASNNHLIDFGPLGFVGGEVNTFRYYGIFPLFKVSRPVTSGLVRVGTMGGGCRGILADFQHVMVIELGSAAPEVQFVEIVVLLPGLTGRGNAVADLRGECRRQIDDRIIAVAVVVFVRAMGIEDEVHALLQSRAETCKPGVKISRPPATT